jgi:predicted phosphate transport protein (TIGR00153 family)
VAAAGRMATPFTNVSFRLTCPPVRLSLTPKTSEFYVLFARAAENALQVARLVDRRFREHPNSGITQEQVKNEETEGDAITRELITLLNTQYLTPFDRDDIYMLAIQLDDIVDELEEASDLLGLYGIELPTKHAVQQTGLIVAATEQLVIACDNLKGFVGVQDALVELKRLEDQGDSILREGLASVFRDDRIDPLMVIRWKDVYDRLESALDSCETAANTVANIVVKNA